MTAAVTVRNTGSRAGTEVVQVYALQPTTHNIIVAPSRRLVGFTRVTLRARPVEAGQRPDRAASARDDAR